MREKLQENKKYIEIHKFWMTPNLTFRMHNFLSVRFRLSHYTPLGRDLSTHRCVVRTRVISF